MRTIESNIVRRKWNIVLLINQGEHKRVMKVVEIVTTMINNNNLPLITCI
jgi:hypothetical protein